MQRLVFTKNAKKLRTLRTLSGTSRTLLSTNIQCLQTVLLLSLRKRLIEGRARLPSNLQSNDFLEVSYYDFKTADYQRYCRCSCFDVMVPRFRLIACPLTSCEGFRSKRSEALARKCIDANVKSCAMLNKILKKPQAALSHIHRQSQTYTQTLHILVSNSFAGWVLANVAAQACGRFRLVASLLMD